MITITNESREYFHVVKALVILWTIHICIQLVISGLRFLKYREVVSMRKITITVVGTSQILGST
jgi:hypothetical protein